MKQVSSFGLLILFSLVVFIGCTDKGTTHEPQPNPSPAIELSVTDKEVIGRSNSFAFDIFQRLNNVNLEDDVFISPLSISIALGMAYNGAVGETKDSIQALLGLEGLTIDEVNNSYKTLITYLSSLDHKVKMEIANSNWYREGLSLKEGYQTLNQDYFDAEVNAVNFHDEATVDMINGWVSDKTHEKIETIISPPLDPQTVLILLNAIYFKGDWTYQFDPDKTDSMTFFMADGSQYLTPIMSQKIFADYYQHDNFQAIDLPYGDGKFAMTLFLPSSGLTVNDFVTEFSEDNFNEWITHFGSDSVNLMLPKFELEEEYSLNDILLEMGMGVAFDPLLADFTDIFADNREICISDVRHKTYVKVNEEGTEAAAVTSIVFIDSVSEEINMFILRPFVFVIRDIETNAIVFMGKIMQPTI